MRVEPVAGAYAPAGGRRETLVLRGRTALEAGLSLPSGAAPLPCVIFAHGLGSSRECLGATVIGRRLLEAEVATVLFDLPGPGAPGAEKQDAEEGFVEDLETVFKWGRSRPELDAERLGVLACGPGALFALRAARRRLIRPAAMVLHLPVVESCGFVGISSPTLVIAGAADPRLPQVRSLAGVNESINFVEVSGAGCFFEQPDTLRRAAELTVDWMLRHLAGAPDEAGYGEIGEGD